MNIEEQIVENYKSGANIYTIYKKFRICNNRILRILKKYNIKIRDGRYRSFSKQEESDICKQYISGIAVSLLTKRYNSDISTISKILKQNNIKKRTLSEIGSMRLHESRAQNTIDFNLAKRKYFDDNLSLDTVARICKVASKTLRIFFEKHGLRVRSGSEPEKNRVERDIWSKYPTKQIIELYISGKSAKYISNHLGILHGTILRLLKRNNIKIRDIEENMPLRNWFKSYILPSGKIINIQGYEPQFLDYVLSNKLLQEGDIVFHPKCIKYKEGIKDRRYFPDFYIPKFNLIVEIKSMWIASKQTAANLYLKQQATLAKGFNYILIIDNDFTEIKNKYFTPKEI